MTIQWKETGDGSLSCRDAETGQLCHNRAGASLEALKNYTEPANLLALLKRPDRTIRLLDACYGLGYNTWVSADFLLRHAKQPFTLSVVAVERSPDMIAESPVIFDHPTLAFLKSKLSPLEHNIYYRTLRCLLDNKVGRFKVRFVEEWMIQADILEGKVDKPMAKNKQFRVQFLIFHSQTGWKVFPRSESDL
jgi:hypothetical protein